MTKRNKKKSLPSRTKRMKQTQRLESVKHWFDKFHGENVIPASRKRYDVDWPYVIKELNMLVVELVPIYVRQQLQETVEGQIKVKYRRKLE